ncbi:MAG TPA: hypothetical protein ENO05_00665 [Bacteroides sp.]|nr:hypothetical protein [Bacteroides sp.]
MKKSFIVLVFVLVAGAATGQTLKKGGIVAFRPLAVTLHPDVIMNQYQDFLINEYFPEIEQAFTGSKIFLLKGDRGAQQQGLAWIWYFDSPGLRAQYWDEEGNFTQAGGVAMEKLGAVIEKSNQFVEAAESGYTDWIILPQSTNRELELQKGTVLGWHHMDLTLAPGATLSQFLDFMAEKYIPELEKIARGWTIYMMKGDRGEHADDYALMYWIESLEARDRLEPEEGVLTEEGKSAVAGVEPLFNELQELGTWTSEYTDWVIQ